ncbi:MAG: 16S rRNA (cytidine(1402)-2'-O)-methyltransferase [Deltaproteobacteria bacterium]|nr:16S rRNA (cytidine(1402)-2'-O)-methyltransferase [Deltaproteobacteria bacterium]
MNDQWPARPPQNPGDTEARAPLDIEQFSASSDRPGTPETDAHEEPGAGVLYVVSTPIGNLKDITLRAIEVLRTVDLIACEDTRKSGILLQTLGVPANRVSLHRFSESRKTSSLLRHLKNGEHVALITDAGTPGISDPGARLVRAALEAGFRVVPIPGPSAVTAALSVSGMEAQTFTFLGFAPRTDDQRRTFFRQIRDRGATAIFFETPKRILRTLSIAQDVLGESRITVMRELTKVHEEILTGTPASIMQTLQARAAIKGEFIITVQGRKEEAPAVDLDRIVKDLITEGFTGKKLADEARKRFGVKKAAAYDRFLKIAGK